MKKRNGLIKLVFMTTNAGLLVSCNLLTPVDTRQVKHLIDKTPNPIKRYASWQQNALVLMPEVDSVFDNKKMAYQIEPLQIAYYSHNQWAATPAQMFQPLLVKTLQRANRFKTVLTPPTISSYAYVLKTKILDFEQDYTLEPAVFRFTLKAQLTRMRDKKVLVNLRKTITKPISPHSPQAGALAANRATVSMLNYVVSRLAPRV